MRSVRLFAVLGAALAASIPALAAPPSMADLDAVARAAGNRKDEAVRLGRVLFGTIWPAQILKVHVDGLGRHLVAGLVLSGVKFHRDLDESGFLDEVDMLVVRSLAASSVEEVDVWATVPLHVDRALPVSGDYAQPTAKTVFAVTVRRAEAKTLRARLRRGDDVFWSSDFRTGLQRTPPGRGQSR